MHVMINCNNKSNSTSRYIFSADLDENGQYVREYTQGDQFIHFNRTGLLYEFIKQYSGEIGHICCNGTGCKLVGLTSTKQVQQIRYDFLKNNTIADGTRSSERAQSECSVCLNTYDCEQRLPCDHSFCADCMVKLVASNLSNTCPLCRSPF